MASLAYRGALATWPGMLRCTYLALSEIIKTWFLARHFPLHELCEVVHVEDWLSILPSMVAAIACLQLAPDKARFANWLLNQLHPIDRGRESKIACKHLFDIGSRIERNCVAAPIKLGLDHVLFKQICDRTYRYLELLMHSMVSFQVLQVARCIERPV